MATENLKATTRISSKLTVLTFLITPIFGFLIAYIIASRTLFTWWGILIALAIIAYSLFFAIFIADANIEADTMTIKKPWGQKGQFKTSEIKTMRKFLGRRHNYFFFTTAQFRFMLVSPIWGPGRTYLENMYAELNNKKV